MTKKGKFNKLAAFTVRIDEKNTKKLAEIRNKHGIMVSFVVNKALEEYFKSQNY